MKKYLPIILFVILLALAGYFIARQDGKVIDISSGKTSGKNNTPNPSPTPESPKSPISGLPCANAQRRPMAVMLSGDAVARPLSGISEADLVFNMPVITDSITRMMAVFVCNSPKELGSIRSTRDDFIPLARGLDAILAHWGGSHFALALLNKGVMDNIDALPNLHSAYFRKSGLASPHNGFTSAKRLYETAKKMNYRLEGKFTGYPHLPEATIAVAAFAKTLDAGFPGSFEVKYVYETVSNLYLRWRGGAKEMDKNTGRQVAAKNVVIMFAQSRQIEGQYNTVAVEGSGKARVYRNGEEIFGTWKKSAASQTSKLFFYDSAGEEIKFTPGQIWVEVVQTNQTITYK